MDPDVPDTPVTGPLATPFVARGPQLHVAAVKELARLRGRFPRIHRRRLPDDASFTALVDGGLIDRRGRPTEDGLWIAELLARPQAWIRVEAVAGSGLGLFEAHVLEEHVLIMASAGPEEATPAPLTRIGLDLRTPDRLPGALTSWLGVPPVPNPVGTPVPSVPSWSQWTVSTMSTVSTVSTDPGSAPMTVVRRGQQYYRLSTTDGGPIRLSWRPRAVLGADLVALCAGLTGSSPAAEREAEPEPLG